MAESTILQQIVARKRHEVATRSAQRSQASLAGDLPPAEHLRPFEAALAARPGDGQALRGLQLARLLR